MAVADLTSRGVVADTVGDGKSDACGLVGGQHRTTADADELTAPRNDQCQPDGRADDDVSKTVHSLVPRTIGKPQRIDVELREGPRRIALRTENGPGSDVSGCERGNPARPDKIFDRRARQIGGHSRTETARISALA